MRCRVCGQVAPAGSVRCPACQSRLAPLKSAIRTPAGDGRSSAPAEQPPALGLGWWRGSDDRWHPPQAGQDPSIEATPGQAAPARGVGPTDGPGPPRPGRGRRTGFVVAVTVVVVVAAGSIVAFTQGSQGSQGPSHRAPTATAGTPSTAPPTTTATDTPAPAETAESAFRRLITDENAGQYGPAWDELVPLQQAFIPRATYVACQSHSAQGAQVSIGEVVGTVAETIAVPGTTTLLSSTTITVNVTVSLGGQSRATTTTVHEFAVAGGWRWSFDQTQVDAYRAGTCPG